MERASPWSTDLQLMRECLVKNMFLFDGAAALIKALQYDRFLRGWKRLLRYSQMKGFVSVLTPFVNPNKTASWYASYKLVSLTHAHFRGFVLNDNAPSRGSH